MPLFTSNGYVNYVLDDFIRSIVVCVKWLTIISASKVKWKIELS